MTKPTTPPRTATADSRATVMVMSFKRGTLTARFLSTHAGPRISSGFIPPVGLDDHTVCRAIHDGQEVCRGVEAHPPQGDERRLGRQAMPIPKYLAAHTGKHRIRLE